MNRAQKNKEFSTDEMEVLKKYLDRNTAKATKPLNEIMSELRKAGGMKRTVKQVTHKINKMGFSVVSDD